LNNDQRNPGLLREVSQQAQPSLPYAADDRVGDNNITREGARESRQNRDAISANECGAEMQFLETEILTMVPLLIPPSYVNERKRSGAPQRSGARGGCLVQHPARGLPDIYQAWRAGRRFSVASGGAA